MRLTSCKKCRSALNDEFDVAGENALEGTRGENQKQMQWSSVFLWIHLNLEALPPHFFFCRHHSQRCLIKEELMAD